MTAAELNTILISMMGLMFAVLLILLQWVARRAISRFDILSGSLTDFISITTATLHQHTRKIDHLEWKVGGADDKRHRVEDAEE